MQIADKRKRVAVYLLNCLLFCFTLLIRFLRKKRKANLQTPTILVSRPDRIGDVLLSTPVYHSLKEKFPNSKIILISYPTVAPLMKANPYINEVWPITCPWWQSKPKTSFRLFLKEYLILFKKIRRERVDIFIELRGDIRQIFLFGWMSNIPVRISNDRSGGTFLLTHPVRYKYNLHEIEKNYELLNFFNPINKYFQTEVYGHIDLESLNKLPAGNSVYVVLFNGGRSPLRKLEDDKVAGIITAIWTKYGVPCIMVGDKSDAETSEKILKMILDRNSLINLCGKLSLFEVKMLIDKATLFIGTDSSINHIAASTKTPSISLFGPMTPCQVKQIGVNKLDIYHSYPCSPCLQTECIVTKSNSQAQCMLDITVEEVLNLADNFLSKLHRESIGKLVSNNDDLHSQMANSFTNYPTRTTDT